VKKLIRVFILALGVLVLMVLACPNLSEAAAYRVQRGDSLWKISSRYHITAAALMSGNHLRSNMIRIGQLLNVPGQAPSTIKPAAPLAKVQSPAATQSRADNGGIVSTALRYLGVRYIYGGTSPKGFDCSGFTQYIFNLNGKHLPRVANDQARVGSRVTSLQPGDLVFFGIPLTGYVYHAGIYIGNNRFVHASNSGIIISSMDETWYRIRYACARRV